MLIKRKDRKRNSEDNIEIEANKPKRDWKKIDEYQEKIAK